MAGTAQAAERIRCDRCTGHYVVDAASDGSPRVRCNKCGHVREAAEPSPASIPGKWTVIGPDGKAMSFDTWEELTESRRPSAIAATAKGLEEANHALKDLKPGATQEKKSASALLDITPAPKLALADMDSAIDLGEPIGGNRAKPGTSTMISGSGTGSTPSGKLEPLLVKSFSQAPKTQGPAAKVEWAPKIDKSVIPARADDNTMRVEVAPAALLASKPSEHAPVTTKVMEADRPTAPKGGASDDSIDELDPDSLLEDLTPDDDDDEGAPLSLRDAIQDEEELGADDLEEDAPDPHEKLSLKDLVVYPGPATRNSSDMPPAKVKSAPPKAVATSQAPPPKSVAPPAPRPKSLSRPDVRSEETAPLPKMSRPPPTITPDEPRSEKAADASSRRASARSSMRVPVDKPNRTWMWLALGGVLLVGIFWRISQNPEQPKQPQKPVATIAPPTPVTTPAMTNDTPPATPTASDTMTTDTPPATSTATVATNTPVVAPNPDPIANPSPNPTPTEKKPVAENPTTAPSPAPTPTEKKPSVPVTDAPGSMSELLDKAGAAKRKGDLATARDLYGRVIAMSPNNVEANGGLGDVAKAQGDLGAAKSSYERALAASPTYSPALLGLADVEWDQGNQASAKKRYAQIVDRMGDRAPARAKERSQ